MDLSFLKISLSSKNIKIMLLGFLQLLLLTGIYIPGCLAINNAYNWVELLVIDSDLIALIDADKLQYSKNGESSIKGKVIEVFKGFPEKKITMKLADQLNTHYFVEGSFNSKGMSLPGRYLIFLKKKNKENSDWFIESPLVTMRAVHDSCIDWFQDNSINKFRPMNIEVVRDYVAHIPQQPKLDLQQECLLSLCITDRLDDSGIGSGGVTTCNYKTFANVLKLGKPAKEHLTNLIDDARPAGRIYAALALLQLNEKEGRLALNKLSTCSDKVWYGCGCKIGEFSVSELAKQSLKMKYPLLPLHYYHLEKIQYPGIKSLHRF